MCTVITTDHLCLVKFSCCTAFAHISSARSSPWRCSVCQVPLLKPFLKYHCLCLCPLIWSNRSWMYGLNIYCHFIECLWKMPDNSVGKTSISGTWKCIVHDLQAMGLNLGRVELGVGSSFFSSWTNLKKKKSRGIVASETCTHSGEIATIVSSYTWTTTAVCIYQCSAFLTDNPSPYHSMIQHHPMESGDHTSPQRRLSY